MPTATANGLQLAYEAFGQASDPAMLLSMGLGGPKNMWEEDFCHGLAERGRRLFIEGFGHDMHLAAYPATADAITALCRYL